ncbi:MAG: DUF983 domain-containing protein [Bacteroidota bacterium]|jgi:uncharacterized protein (DUF983 family)
MKWSDLSQGRCSRCHTGSMFQYPATDLRRATRMHDDCPHCGFHFEIEPGFFWGAMYISYAFSVAVSVIFGVAAYLVFDDPALWVYCLCIFTPLLLLAPLSMRYSRVLMLHWFGDE